MTMDRTTLPGAKRHHWVDYARFLAITLVVAHHTLAGLRSDHPRAGAYDYVLDAVATFRMPLFFFVSGFLFYKTVTQVRGGFLKSSLVNFAWPYVLWSAVFVAIMNLVPVPVNNRVPVRELAFIAFDPIAHFWFIYVLLVCRTLIYLSASRLRGAARAGLVTGLVLLGLAGYHLLDHRELPGKLAMGVGFIALGILFRTWYERRGAANQPVAKTAWLMLVGGAAFALHLVLVAASGNPEMSVAAALLGIVFSLCLCMLLPGPGRSPLLRACVAIAQASIAIYLVHPIVAAATRIGMRGLGLDNLELLFLGATILAIALPAVAYFMADRLGLTAYVGFGAGTRRIREADMGPLRPNAPSP